jgi:DNA ligase (NAD+)
MEEGLKKAFFIFLYDIILYMLGKKEEIKKRLEVLRETINHHRYLYHVKNISEISEEALDSLKDELKKYEEMYPDLITPDSPSQSGAGTV